MTIPRRDTNNIKFFPFILYITNTSFPYNPIQTSITSYTSLNTKQWKRGWKRQWTREGIIILPDTISIHNYNTNTTQLKYHTTTNIPYLSIILYPTSNSIITITQITATTTHNTNNNNNTHYQYTFYTTHIQIHSIQLSIHHSILSNPHQHTIHSIQSTTINNHSIIITTHTTYSIHNQTHTLPSPIPYLHYSILFKLTTIPYSYFNSISTTSILYIPINTSIYYSLTLTHSIPLSTNINTIIITITQFITLSSNTLITLPTIILIHTTIHTLFFTFTTILNHHLLINHISITSIFIQSPSHHLISQSIIITPYMRLQTTLTHNSYSS